MYGVLWDMDGVLVNTGEFHWQAWSKTFAERDISFTYEQFRTTFGMNNMGVLKLLLGEEVDPALVEEISDRKESLFREAVKGQVRPLPGVLEWLECLVGWGVKHAVASSAPPANIETLLDELAIRRYFSAILSGSDLPGKPEPDVFLKAAHEIGVSPSRCVVVEDAVTGVEAAKRAGMKCIAVTTTNPAHELVAADIIVERLDALAIDEFKQLLWGDQ
jgi:beta-phosphoglucomutase family hydrolase